MKCVSSAICFSGLSRRIKKGCTFWCGGESSEETRMVAVVAASRTRGEACLVNGGDSIACCIHVSHKSKSQICERIRNNLRLFLALRIPCIEVRCRVARGPLRNYRSAFLAEGNCVASTDVRHHRLVHDSQNPHACAPIRHKMI